MEQVSVHNSDASDKITEYVHSCSYCEKIVLNLDYDDMASEDGEWMNTRLQATFDNVIEAAENGCDFAEELAVDSTVRTTSNGHW
jgi:hypothetical protein